MLKVITIVLLILLVGVVVAGLLFFRGDLARDQLSSYVSVESQFIELPSGATVHLRDEGKATDPVVVLLHGGLGSLHNWEPWTPDLRSKHRVITMDLPGHGLTGRIPSDQYTRESMVAFVAEVLRSLDVDSFALVGHSMGGGVALAYTLEFPDQVESLILVGSEGVPSDEGYDADELFVSKEPREETQADVSLTMTERALTRLSSPWLVRQTLKAMVANNELVTEEFVESFGTVLRHEGNRHAFALMFKQFPASINMKVDLKPRLQEISAPTLILIGGDDSLVPVSVGKAFDEGIPSSELVIYDGVGHLIMQEAPERSVGDVTRFLSDRG